MWNTVKVLSLSPCKSITFRFECRKQRTVYRDWALALINSTPQLGFLQNGSISIRLLSLSLHAKNRSEEAKENEQEQSLTVS